MPLVHERERSIDLILFGDIINLINPKLTVIDKLGQVKSTISRAQTEHLPTYRP